MTGEIERLLNDHDNAYAHTMTSLKKRLDAKTELRMRKLDEILRGSNQENRSDPIEDSRKETDGSGTHSHAEAPPRSRTSFEPNHRVAPLRAAGQIQFRQKPMPHRGYACPRTACQIKPRFDHRLT